MSDFITTSQFDEMIRQSYGVPPIRADFVNRLQSELTQKAAQKPGKAFHFLRAQPVWTFAAILVTLMIIATLAIGPQKVYAAVARLLGYIPGVGVVEQSADIRVLAEPVTVTRDDISVTVTSAVLTAESTHIEFRIFGVPRSAYPNQENIMGCIRQPYLRLSDGTQLEQLNDFPPVPATENEAVFVMPCIFDTLPGTVPENWELALQFVAAPPDFTVIPVVESLPTHTPTALANTAEPAAAALSITKVLEVGDKFVLMGEFNYRAPYGDSLPPDAWWAISQIAITGADGRAVPQSYSNDFDYPSPSQSGVEGWLYQLEKNFVPPVTITYSGQIITPQEPIEQAGFEFDAGLNPQNGNHWEINQDFNLGGYNIRLLSIDSNERGYTFNFQADPGASAHLIQVEIADFQPNCGGGGDGNQFPLEFSRSVCYAAMPGGPEFPHGVLKVLVHFQPLLREDKTFQLQWTPDMAQNGTYATSTPQPGVCASTALPAQLQPLPAEQANGKVLLYEKLPGTGDWSLVLYTLNGGQTQRQVVVSAGNWAAFSPDGSRLAYADTSGIAHVLDLTTQADTALPGLVGRNMFWSPDGKRIAFISSGGNAGSGLFIANSDGSQIIQISAYSNEAMVGWSADASRLYFVVPFTGGAAWKLYAFDTISGVEEELFVIENGTPKFLNPRLSWDGNWIAYRGRDNSSLYLVRSDGSETRLLMDNAGVVGIGWTQSSRLGLGLRKPNSEESSFILLDPSTCQVYSLLPDAEASLETIWMP